MAEENQLETDIEKQIWKVKGEGDPVTEVWEDFYGNLWFTTEIMEDGFRFGYARLHNMPDCAEWGYFSIEHIKEQLGKFKVWQVSKENWSNIDTYEKGLLVQVK